MKASNQAIPSILVHDWTCTPPAPPKCTRPDRYLLQLNGKVCLGVVVHVLLVPRPFQRERGGANLSAAQTHVADQVGSGGRGPEQAIPEWADEMMGVVVVVWVAELRVWSRRCWVGWNIQTTQINSGENVLITGLESSEKRWIPANQQNGNTMRTHKYFVFIECVFMVQLSFKGSAPLVLYRSGWNMCTG